MLELFDQPRDPFDRDVFDPGHFTVGAFAVADDSVMLVHHRRLQMWLEPGGHVDPEDASPEAAAVRELEEETGIVAGPPIGGIFDIDVHDIPAAAGEPEHKHFNVSYHFAAATTDVVEVEEVLEARWVPLDGVAALSDDPAVLRSVEKLAAYYRR